MNIIDEMLEEGIAAGVFPGAALLVARDDTVFHRAVYGHAMERPERHLLQFGTLFDVASLTKVLATTAMAMRLVQAGILDLAQPLGEILPVFAESAYQKVTLRHLLEHTSGLPAYRPYYEKFEPRSVPDLNTDQTLERYLAWIAQESPLAACGGKRLYSDLDFIVLGAVLERKAQVPLRQLFHREVEKPLALRASGYSPLTAALKQSGSVAATAEESWRGRVLCGEVDDQNAYVLGGAAGHAGLFTCLDDCHRLAMEVVRASRGESSWLVAKTLSVFLAPSLTHCLGWDRPDGQNSQAGHCFSSATVGHLGFTGCSLWIDLESGVSVIFLTNRVHPDRSNDKIKPFRPRLHDAIFRHYRGLA